MKCVTGPDPAKPQVALTVACGCARGRACVRSRCGVSVRACVCVCVCGRMCASVCVHEFVTVSACSACECVARAWCSIVRVLVRVLVCVRAYLRIDAMQIMLQWVCGSSWASWMDFSIKIGSLLRQQANMRSSAHACVHTRAQAHALTQSHALPRARAQADGDRRPLLATGEESQHDRRSAQ